jgi:hypothetical protein
MGASHLWLRGLRARAFGLSCRRGCGRAAPGFVQSVLSDYKDMLTQIFRYYAAGEKVGGTASGGKCQAWESLCVHLCARATPR